MQHYICFSASQHTQTHNKQRPIITFNIHTVNNPLTQVEFVMPTLKKIHYICYKSLQKLIHTSFVFVVANKKMAQFEFQALALILLIFGIEGKWKHTLNWGRGTGHRRGGSVPICARIWVQYCPLGPPKFGKNFRDSSIKMQ